MRKSRKWMSGPKLIAVLLLISFKAGAQTTNVDLRKAIETALANNYSLKADSMNIIAAGYQAEAVRADLRPQVNYSSRMEYNPAIPVQMLPGNLVGQPNKEYVAVQFGSRYNINHGVEMTQGIIRPDLRYRIQVAEMDKTISRTKHTMTKEELVFAVVNTYFSLQAKAEMIRTTGKDYSNLKEITQVAKSQVENGVLKRIDYESLQINTANKEADLKQQQSDYNDQLTYFKYLLGVSPAEPLAIDQNISGVTDVTEYLDDQLLKREDIKLYRQLIQSKELEIKGIRAERLPVLNSYFKFNYQSQFNQADKAFNNDYWFKSSSIGLSTSIPLFDGKRRKNRINIAQSQLQQLKFNSEYQKQQAKTEQVQAWEALGNDREQYLITKQNLVLAEKVFTSRRALYTEGVTTLIELLDAEKELTQSRNLHIQALINVKASLVKVHKANGTLLTDFINLLP